MRPVHHYAVAALAVFLTLIGRWLLWPVLGPAVPYLPFIPAVALAAYFGGFRPGLLATLLAAAAATYFLVDPAGPDRPATPSAETRLVLFLLVGFIISAVGGAHHRTSHRAKEASARARDGEDRLRTLSDNLPHGAIYQAVIDPAGRGRFIYFSAGVERLFGVTPDEIKRDPGALYGLIHEDDRARVAAEEAAALRALTPFDCVFRQRTRGGDVLWVHCRSAPRRLPDGGAVWDGVVLDVTAPKRAEDALRESEARLAAELAAMSRLHELSTRLLRSPDLPATLNEVLDAAVTVLGADMGTVQLHDPRTGTLEVVAQKGFGEEFLDRFRRVGTDTESACGRALRAGARVVIEDVRTDPGYEPYREAAEAAGYQAVQSTPLLRPCGGPLGMLSTYFRRPHRPSERDLRILDLYAAQAAAAIDNAQLYQAARAVGEELRRTNAELAERDRRKDEFLALLGHELRNPLAPICNAVHILGLNGDDPGTRARAREMIGRQVGQMTKLVDELLDASRIARGKVRLTVGAVDLVGLARTTAEDHRAEFEAAGLTLVVEAPDRPVRVRGDAARLTQVAGNILLNAKKFTNPGGRVTVRAAAEGGEGVLSVTDTGIGIAPAALGEVFEPFHQVETDLARSKGGLGLGLAVVKGLVELHGGRVEAASGGPGRGATFTV
ncbi:MAG: hypothetical protein JWO38_2692, partial [Gemmataceae bacterium]|nr:hypothetical protein [Gemmataceae bacterium]